MTRAELLRVLRAKLAAAHIDNEALDARLLVGHALGLTEMDFIRDPDAAVSAEKIAAAEALIERRAAREPVARILGMQEFYGLAFMLGPDTLIPRPETEMLVDEALRRLPDGARARLLDLGTGTGCILLSVLHERPTVTGLGIDTAPGAVAMAQANAARLGLAGRAQFRQGDWAEGIAGPFDLIVSNPPYIDSGLVPQLAPEVARHDPARALDGGSDGLDAYRAIIPALPRLLKPGGAALLEIGYDQGERVAALGVEAGMAAGAVRRDLAGHGRMLVLTRA